jgi:hypothetical protein
MIGLTLGASFLCGNIACAKTFTGHFQGQGAACWGNLWIRTKPFRGTRITHPAIRATQLSKKRSKITQKTLSI